MTGATIRQSTVTTSGNGPKTATSAANLNVFFKLEIGFMVYKGSNFWYADPGDQKHLYAILPLASMAHCTPALRILPN